MQITWIVAMASACLMAPAVASAQSSQAPAHPSRAAVADTGQATKPSGGAKDTTTSTSAGEVSSSTANVPQAALAAQKNPHLIGSPAWWSTHATADGKPKHGA